MSDFHAAPASYRSGWHGSRPQLHLPLKQLAQQLHRLGIAAQREAQISRQLPHYIIFRIVSQDQQILFEGIGGLPFLQEFFRTLHALP